MGDHGGLGPVAGTELGHRPVDMGLGGQRREGKPLGDVVVGHLACEEPDALALGEDVEL